MSRGLTGVVVLLSIGACTAITGTTDTSNGGNGALQSIDLSTGSQSLQPDDSISLTATGHYSNGGTKDLTDSASWTSDNATAVSVGNTAGTKGRVAAVGTGTAMITASYAGQQGMATITAVGVSSIAVNPATPSLDSGATTQLHAVATFSATVGGDPDVTTRATWTSSDPTKVTVNDGANKGLVTALGGGSATITATFKGVGGTTSVTSIVIDSVTIGNLTGGALGGYFPIGGTFALRATAYYSNSNSKDVTDSVAWASTTSAMSVSSTGLVSRSGEDSSFIKATLHGRVAKVLLHKGCVVLADNLSFDQTNGSGVANIKVDAGGVVWFDYDPLQPGTGGAFRTVPAAGGSVQTIKSGIPFAGQWDMDASYIYWIWVDTQGAQSYYVVRLSRSTGVIDTLHSEIGLGGGSRGLAVDANYLYYAPGDDGGVRRMAKTGGAATAFYQNVNPFGPRMMSLASGTVYAVLWDASPHWVIKLPTNGSAVDTLGQANTATYSQVSGAYFYWSENNPGNRIARVATAGGAIATVATITSQGFTIAGSNLYYSQQGASASSIVRSPLAGGAVQVVTDACGSSLSTGIRVQFLTSDGTYIYFVEDGGGTGASRVLRVKK
jgi:hypothetical protein